MHKSRSYTTKPETGFLHRSLVSQPSFPETRFLCVSPEVTLQNQKPGFFIDLWFPNPGFFLETQFLCVSLEVASYYYFRQMIYFPTQLFLIVEPWQIYSLPAIAEVRYQTDYFSEYPQQIRVGTDRSAVLYQRQPGYYAVHYNKPGAIARGAILQLNDGAIAVYSGQPDNNSTQATIGPIYTLQPNGSLAVPTGMVFIRFAENVEVESHRQAIEQAGYEIAQSLSYAPHAAWLRAQSGKISDALTGISKLAAIPNVENVEPQMLMARVLRQ